MSDKKTAPLRAYAEEQDRASLFDPDTWFQSLWYMFTCRDRKRERRVAIARITQAYELAQADLHAETEKREKLKQAAAQLARSGTNRDRVRQIMLRLKADEQNYKSLQTDFTIAEQNHRMVMQMTRAVKNRDTMRAFRKISAPIRANQEKLGEELDEAIEMRDETAATVDDFNARFEQTAELQAGFVDEDEIDREVNALYESAEATPNRTTITLPSTPFNLPSADDLLASTYTTDETPLVTEVAPTGGPSVFAERSLGGF